MANRGRAARADRHITKTWLLLLAATALVLIAVAWLLPAQTARGKGASAPDPTEASPSQEQAAQLALHDSRVQARLAGRRAEVMAVMPLGAQRTADSLACALSDCRLVEIYNFDRDATVSAIVDLPASLVRDVLYQPHVHPEPNSRLKALAIQVAVASAEFTHELGRVPAAAELLPMVSGVPGTACDRGHLCLAVTAPQGQSLVWAIVDVTAGTLVSVLRTPALAARAGQSVAGPAAPTDCPASGSVTRGGLRF